MTAARESWDRKASVIIPIILRTADRIFGMPCSCQPSRFHSWTCEGVECWLSWMADCSRWRRLEETAGQCEIEFGPLCFIGPLSCAWDSFALRVRRSKAQSCKTEELVNIRDHCRG